MLILKGLSELIGLLLDGNTSFSVRFSVESSDEDMEKGMTYEEFLISQLNNKGLYEKAAITAIVAECKKEVVDFQGWNEEMPNPNVIWVSKLVNDKAYQWLKQNKPDAFNLNLFLSGS